MQRFVSAMSAGSAHSLSASTISSGVAGGMISDGTSRPGLSTSGVFSLITTDSDSTEPPTRAPRERSPRPSVPRVRTNSGNRAASSHPATNLGVCSRSVADDSSGFQVHPMHQNRILTRPRGAIMNGPTVDPGSAERRTRSDTPAEHINGDHVDRVFDDLLTGRRVVSDILYDK